LNKAIRQFSGSRMPPLRKIRIALVGAATCRPRFAPKKKYPERVME